MLTSLKQSRDMAIVALKEGKLVVIRDLKAVICDLPPHSDILDLGPNDSLLQMGDK